MFADVDVALFYCCAAVDHAEGLHFSARFCHDLSVEVELQCEF